MSCSHRQYASRVPGFFRRYTKLGIIASSVQYIFLPICTQLRTVCDLRKVGRSAFVDLNTISVRTYRIWHDDKRAAKMRKKTTWHDYRRGLGNKLIARKAYDDCTCEDRTDLKIRRCPISAAVVSSVDPTIIRVYRCRRFSVRFARFVKTVCRLRRLSNPVLDLTRRF